MVDRLSRGARVAAAEFLPDGSLLIDR